MHIAGRSTSHIQAGKNIKWRFPWGQFIASLIIFLGICVFMYPTTASWLSQYEQSRVITNNSDRLNSPPYDNQQYLDRQLEKAHAYNDALSSGADLKANTRKAVGTGESKRHNLSYENLLNPLGNGFMGRLKYKALDIDLPIYHGTSDKILSEGVGHLEGTSLPVGGIGTRSVLTAHRGLPKATLFNNLNKAKKGDIFTVSVLHKVLAYKVIDTTIVLPDDHKSILPEPGRDLITLVTCTPLGINSHRILVTAERVIPTPDKANMEARKDPDIPRFPWWASILSGSLAVLIFYNWRMGRPQKYDK